MSDRVHRDDRGAVLILVAVFSIVAVIFLAFVVDIGNQRQDRRQLTTATDASALDVATRWSDAGLAKLSNFTLISGTSFKGVYDCTADAQDFLDRNRAVDAGDYECRAEILSPRLASVRVFAEGETDYQVAPAFGVDGGGVGSSTAVRITAHPFGGLRPFALCASQPAFNAWYTSPDASNPDTVTPVTITGDKFLPEQCGKNNSDWGFVQFETQDGGTGNGNDNKLAGTIKNGSDDEISPYYDAGDAHRERCLKDYDDQKTDHGSVTCIFDTSGAGGWNNSNTMDAFEYLRAPPGVTFALPIYDRIVDLGGGKTGFPIIAFAEARLVSYVQGGAEDNSVRLDLIRVWNTQPGFIGANNRILDICDVGTVGGAQLTSFGDACQPGGGSGGGSPPVGSVDPCVVTLVSPLAQSVEVTAGSSDGPVTVDVTVQEASDCSGLSATASSGTTTIDLPQVSQSGDVFRFTRAPGAPFGATGLQYTVDILQGGSVRDDSARINTVAGAIPCDVTAIPRSPTPYRQAGSGASNDLLVGAFSIGPVTNNSSRCSGMTITLGRLKTTGSGTTVDREMVQSSFDGSNATYSNTDNDKQWSLSRYRVTVTVDGSQFETEFDLTVAPSP
jgi:hypothetical protein